VVRVNLEDVVAKKQAEELVVEEIMAGMQDATRELRSHLEVAQINLADAERGISGLQTEKETICTSMQLASTRKDTANKNMLAAETKLTNCAEEHANLQGKVVELNVSKRAAESNAQKLQLKLKSLQQQELQIQSR
jgi:uncharacterized protein (DUF3084 family)